MHPFPAPATALLCLAMLLLTLRIASSTVDAINTTASPFCEPAKCGNLGIGYPFWLAGTHPPECGFRAFQVTCDHGNASLGNGLWTYQIRHIFYHNSSFMVTNEQLSEGSCDIESNFNASSDLGLAPFNISPQNRELFFLYNCTQTLRPPSSWAPVRCGGNESSNSSYACFGEKYRRDGSWSQLPGNCTVSMVPVLGYDDAAAKDYERLIKGGFLLEYTQGPSDCTYCLGSGGWCRVNVTDDGLECQCPDGKLRGRKCTGVKLNRALDGGQKHAQSVTKKIIGIVTSRSWL